jgi:AraC-like DNA-binding protein
MAEMLRSLRPPRLEGLCSDAAKQDAAISIAQPCDGIERLEARFAGRAFAPHRHDTYAIGITLSGVQTFRYRGEARYCLAGQCHVLHPDETHDGAAGTEEGFSYRIAYVDPALVQSALGGRPLPFVGNPVVDLTAAQQRAMMRVWTSDEETDELARTDIAAIVADFLMAMTAGHMPPTPLPLSQLQRVRESISASPTKRHSMAELERLAGLDRWSLARQFRAAFGTSPSRFRTMRQLDMVRGMIRSGSRLADAALAAGFADQSHMSRQFKRAYGMTPARWIAALSPQAEKRIASSLRSSQ